MKYQSRQPDFKVFTKNQLIKKLKKDNNFNWEFVSTLNADKDYIYSKGSVGDIYSLSERGQTGAYKRIDQMLFEVKENFPQPAQERERKSEFEYVIDLVERYIKREDVVAVKALLSKLLKDATAGELRRFEFENLKYDITAKEYISVSVRASVWSYYISGSVEIIGTKFTAENVSYRASEANRL